MGFIDDKYNLPSWIRYLTQVLTVYFIFQGSYLSDFFNINFTNNFVNFSLVFFFIILGTALINFINFMDGIDCLVATCFIAFFLTISNHQSFQTLIIAGSLLGFLPYNLTPAKVFMGDVGSTFLGAYLITILFDNKNIFDSYFMLMIIMPLFLDAIICIILRLKLKQNIFTAHKNHLYQRLAASGLSHMRVTSLYLIAVCINCIVFKLLNVNILYITNFLYLGVGFYIHKKYATKIIN